jgi:16S rRNA (guanine527-N7)-methyltransferase
MQFALISRYVDILTSRGVDRGLLGPREIGRVWQRHILNRVAIADLIPWGAEVLDVGSGAGLPGLPLAISRGDLTLTLLEPLLRRSNFLVETVDELGLAERVRVVRARVEDHRRHYGVVTARAVAPLPKLLTWLAPVRSTTGIILALKGACAAGELAASAEVLARLGLTAELRTVRAVPQAEPTTVVRVGSVA